MTTKNTATSTKTKTLGECCPIFHPEKWENKTFNWENKQFLKASVPALFHVPLVPMMGKKITKMMKSAEEANKLEKDRENILLLFTDPNPFKSDMYLSVTDEIPEVKNETLSGTFVSRVYQGDFKEVPSFIKNMNALLTKRNQKAAKYFVHYAYCPDCAEEAGHNYAVLFAQLNPAHIS